MPSWQPHDFGDETLGLAAMARIAEDTARRIGVPADDDAATIVQEGMDLAVGLASAIAAQEDAIAFLQGKQRRQLRSLAALAHYAAVGVPFLARQSATQSTLRWHARYGAAALERIIGEMPERGGLFPAPDLPDEDGEPPALQGELR